MVQEYITLRNSRRSSLSSGTLPPCPRSASTYKTREEAQKTRVRTYAREREARQATLEAAYEDLDEGVNTTHQDAHPHKTIANPCDAAKHGFDISKAPPIAIKQEGSPSFTLPSLEALQADVLVTDGAVPVDLLEGHRLDSFSRYPQGLWVP